MRVLKADTAVNVIIGPFVDATDGVTPETGVTLSGADEAELLKHGSTSVNDISGSTWGAVTSCDGWYWLSLTTGNTDTEGPLTIAVQDDSVCLPVHAHFMVVNANVYDSLYAAATTDYLQVDTLQVEGSDATDQINAEVSDVLKTDTISELSQGAPATTPTFETAMMALYMALINKLDVDADYKEVHNNAGTVIFKKALTDDGSTYSEANAESG